MSELDMKILKRKLEVPWSYLTADEGQAIIAALEDRERLRVAMERSAAYCARVTAYGAVQVSSAELDIEKLKQGVIGRLACPAWPDCADDEGPCLACAQVIAILGALKELERLRAAAKRVCNAVDPPAALVDWCKVPSADILALMAALEGRDG